MEELLKQAKLKALRLLTDMDRTEEQLRVKLKQKEYPDEIVEQAIEYVKSFGYVDDVNYAKKFIESKKRTKSRYEIYGALMQKGLSKELVSESIRAYYDEEDEIQAIRALLSKKRFSAEEISEQEKMKMIAYFTRKGFNYESVCKGLEVSSRNA